MGWVESFSSHQHLWVDFISRFNCTISEQLELSRYIIGYTHCLIWNLHVDSRNIEKTYATYGAYLWNKNVPAGGYGSNAPQMKILNGFVPQQI